MTYEKRGELVTVPCDSVVISGGMASRQEAITGFAALTPHVHVVGDCKAVGDIRNAIRDGYTAASRL